MRPDFAAISPQMKLAMLVLAMALANVAFADEERRIRYLPYFMRYPSYYRRPPKSTSPSLYNFLMPLALLGITLPAMGLMYTYFSRRRRRDLDTNLEQLEQYLSILKASLERFQRQLEGDLVTH